MTNTKVLYRATLALLVSGMVVVGCHDHSTNPDQIVGTGKLVSQTRTLPTFSSIQITGTAKVIITQDTIQSLRIEADDNIIDRVTAAVSNGLLIVGLEQGSYNNVTINVYASMKSIDRLECVGTANFVTAAAIHTDAITCRITGAGTMTLTGTATNQTVEVTGTGDVHNLGLISDRCSAMIMGVGNLEVNVTQQLDALISGSGSIVYAGQPTIVNKTITGIGSVRPFIK